MSKDLDGCGKCMKFSLFVANFVLLFAGIGLVVIGGLALRNQSKFVDIVGNDSYKVSTYLVLGAGIFVILFAFMGCCGAVQEKKCLLIIYVTILLVMFLVLLAAGILALIFKANDETADSIKQEMRNTMYKYDSDKNLKDAWDAIQNVFKCCGIDNGIGEWKTILGKIPKSCCKDENKCSNESFNPPADEFWNDGCLKIFTDGAALIGYVSIGISAVLLLGIIFSCGLIFTI